MKRLTLIFNSATAAKKGSFITNADEIYGYPYRPDESSHDSLVHSFYNGNDNLEYKSEVSADLIKKGLFEEDFKWVED